MPRLSAHTSAADPFTTPTKFEDNTSILIISVCVARIPRPRDSCNTTCRNLAPSCALMGTNLRRLTPQTRRCDFFGRPPAAAVYAHLRDRSPRAVAGAVRGRPRRLKDAAVGALPLTLVGTCTSSTTTTTPTAGRSSCGCLSVLALRPQHRNPTRLPR